MSAVTVDQLLEQVRRIREEPGLAFEESSNMSLEQVPDALESVRASLIAAVDAAPDSAFAPQPANGEGEAYWSVGEVVGHSNGTALGIGANLFQLSGHAPVEPPAALANSSEPRPMTRAEARQAARAVNYRELFGGLTDDSKLDATEEHNFFGTMSGRSWLYFIAMHEADHVNQIRELNA